MENRVGQKSYASGVPVSVACEGITMPEILSRTAKWYPDRTAMVFFGEKISGTVPAPNSPLYTDRELEHQLNDFGASPVVTMDLLAPRPSGEGTRQKWPSLFPDRERSSPRRR